MSVYVCVCVCVCVWKREREIYKYRKKWLENMKKIRENSWRCPWTEALTDWGIQLILVSSGLSQNTHKDGQRGLEKLLLRTPLHIYFGWRHDKNIKQEKIPTDGGRPKIYFACLSLGFAQKNLKSPGNLLVQ